jgi:hypothetical protein
MVREKAAVSDDDAQRDRAIFLCHEI